MTSGAILRVDKGTVIIISDTMALLAYQNGVPTKELAGEEEAADPKSAAAKKHRTLESQYEVHSSELSP